MACVTRIRETVNIKLDGWSAYVQTVAGQLDTRSTDNLGGLQAAKLRLLGSLEQLGRELNDAKTLATAVRSRLEGVSRRLRVELSAERPADALGYAKQKEALLAAMSAAEGELNAIAAAVGRGSWPRLEAIVERTVRAMLRLEAELEVAEVRFRTMRNGRASVDADRARELSEHIRSLSATIATARTLAADGVSYVEPEIVSGLRRLRELFAELVA